MQNEQFERDQQYLAAPSISNFAYIMEYSMYKTFARKYRTSMKKIISQYSVYGKFRVPYETKNGTRHCYFYNEGFQRKKTVDRWLRDTLPAYRPYDRPHTLAGRLKSGICELCGAKTNDMSMHHVRKLADLTGKTEWETLMKAKRRKTLAVCPRCHEGIHCKTAR